MRALTALLVVAVLAAAASAGGVVIRLRSAARVEVAEVTLGQVASVSGPDRAVRALQAVVLAEGLRPGGVVRITSEDVRAALREAGFDPRAVAVTGAREVVVRRAEGSAAVRRGASVRVVAAVGAVRVSAGGVALEAGDAGDVVRVRVLATRKEVLARVIQPGLVAVVF
ncbi:MAG: flagella basal body P-ring formation protein FlgA [Firmicutes bacterium]|nr:flagella basal body P-ring formation protein FlgA [Bacillota bacterium]